MYKWVPVGFNELLRLIYTLRFLLTIVACDFYRARCSRHGKIVYDFHDIKLPVATIVVGFYIMFQKPTTFFVSYTIIAITQVDSIYTKQLVS